MPPRDLLTVKDARELALQAATDFPGLVVLLEPVITPRPMTADMTIQGYVLIVAGPRGSSPWFELRSALAYDDLYEQIYAHYDVLEPCAPDDADVEPDEPDEPDAPVPCDVLPLWGDGQGTLCSVSNSPLQYTSANKEA